MVIATREAYKLLHDGSLALANVEANGIRIDVGYLESTINRVGREIKELEAKLTNDKIFRTWRKRFGDRTNLGSKEQLGKVLFDELDHKCSRRTATGKYKVDESSLEGIDLDFVRDYIKLGDLKQTKGTFLEGIRKEVCEGYLHPGFHLNTVRTVRGSSSSPNFQNQPIRDRVKGEAIRRCFIPRNGRVLLEVDYGGIEVKICSCYHKDPVMLDYIKDSSKDMHRDQAAACYMLDPGQVSKQVRYCGKNCFVFPQFYGDFWLRNAKALWEAIPRMKLTTVDGMPLRKHLKSKGIKKLGGQDPRNVVEGTFEAHIKQVEDEFWELFKVYDQWKEEWYQKYLKRGWFRMLTGFVEDAYLSRNDVINHPVQGVAFHCLLWSLIQLQRWLRKNKFKSLIVGQIHDSIVIDAVRSELAALLPVIKRIMTVDIREHWPWLITPLEVEAEVGEENWFEKKAIKI